MSESDSKYSPRLHVVLHQPEIAYNTGSVGRTCVAAEAKLWLVRPLGFRVDDYYLRRAGLDYWKRLVWEVVDDCAALETALPAGRRWLFTKKAERSFWSVDFAPGDVLVFGCESRGLPPALRAAHADATYGIPIASPHVRSLNLATAVAVVLYEARRQLEAW